MGSWSWLQLVGWLRTPVGVYRWSGGGEAKHRLDEMELGLTGQLCPSPAWPPSGSVGNCACAADSGGEKGGAIGERAADRGPDWTGIAAGGRGQ
jgi:hypothetical protein